MGNNYFNRDDRDLKFVLFEYLDMEKLLSYEAYQDFSTEDFNMIIDEALKVCREVLGPTMQDGDKEGCTYKDGEVKVPASFHDCWKVMAENGWMAASSNPEFGGQGLPATVGGLISELFAGANMEYPVNPDVQADATVAAWGSFKENKLNIAKAGELQAAAIRLMDRAGYR